MTPDKNVTRCMSKSTINLTTPEQDTEPSKVNHSTNKKVNSAASKDDKASSKEFNEFEQMLLDSAMKYQNQIHSMKDEYEQQLRTMSDRMQSLCQNRTAEVLEMSRSIASLEQNILVVESRALHRKGG